MIRSQSVIILLYVFVVGRGLAEDLHFTSITSGVNSSLNAVAFGGNSFVAAGANSTVLRSSLSTGSPVLSWIGSSAPISDLNLRSVEYGSDLFAVGGQNSDVFGTPDGATVTFKGEAFSSNHRDVRGLAFAGGWYVAVADGLDIRRSSNLVNWQISSLVSAVGLETYRAVESFDGNFVVVGTRGTIRISSDGGATWKVSRPWTANESDLLGVASGGGRLVAVGAAGKIVVSSDNGVSWNPQTVGTINLNAVAYTGKQFVAVGNAGTIRVSSDGSNWTVIPIGSSKDLFGVAQGSGDFQGVTVVVGDGGTILVGGENPAKPVGSDPSPICPGVPDPDILKVIVHAGETADWYSQEKEGTPLTNGTGKTAFSPGIAVDGTTTVFWAEARDLRTGLKSASRAKLTMVVNAVPRITAQPTAPPPVCPGEPVSLSVAADGTGLIYQWRLGGQNIPGANSSTYAIPAATAGHDGNYDVVVSGACSPSATSVAVRVTVNAPPSITVQPTAPLPVCPGEPVSLSVAATGTGLNYRWRLAGQDIPGANNASYVIAKATAGHDGDYDVVVSGVCNPPVTSAKVKVTVNTPPSITVQPTAPAPVCPDNPVTLSVTAAGTGLSYRWRLAGQDIPGANNSTYAIAKATAGDDGEYDVVVSGTCNPPVTSVAVKVTVNTPPSITVQPTAPAPVCPDNPVTLSVTAAGTGLSYRWRLAGQDIPGANNSTYAIAKATAGDDGDYDVVVSGTCNPPVTSVTVKVTVNVPPSITLQPLNATACLTSSATFVVTAAGTAPLTYQWMRNGTNLIDGGSISGAGTVTLTLSNVTTNEVSSNYSVKVSNACGQVTSSVVALTQGGCPSRDPSLTIERINTQVLVKWEPATGFQLERASALTIPAVIWEPIQTLTNSYKIDATGSGYFRLRKL